MAVTTLAIATFVISAVSAAYQVIQAKKMKEQADRAAEARRGFEVPVEGSAADLPLVYGIAMVGGARTWHATASEYKHVTPNADKTFATGGQSSAAYTMNYTSWPGVIGNVVNVTTQNNTLNVPPGTGSYLDVSQTGRKNEYLFFQQALCVGPIGAIHDVIIDGSRYIDDPALGTYGHSESDDKTRIKAAMRIDCHYGNTPIADAIAGANFGDRQNAVFQDMAHISAVVRIDRDDPQFSGVPQLQFLIEGRKIFKLVGGALATTRTYSNNPAECLVDYLMDPTVGKDVPIEEIDLESFANAAAICDIIAQAGVAVGGKLYQPTDGARNITSTNLRLYECNIVLDPRKPVRENIEAILATMGDARLVWSAGQYRLSLQYPTSNEAIELDEELTDDDLVLGQEIEINWPSASERLNNATVRFHNAFENFKEDSVSWPPKVTDSYYKGIGGFRYGLPNGSWGEDKVGGRLLNNYGVWDTDANGITLTWLMKVEGEKAGNYDVTYTADNNISLTVYETKRAGGADLQIFTGSRTDWHGVNKNSITLGVAGQTKFYKIVAACINDDDPVSKKGAAIKIDNATTILWSSREPTYSDFVLVSYDSTIYDAMYAEDGNLELETDIFSDGITDPYHALAKAEELVRTSRSAFSIKFIYKIKTKYPEPGDFIKLTSSTLSLGFGISPLYLRLDSVKVNENAECEITATRFDYTQLAWNVKDDVYVVAPSLYQNRMSPPTDIAYTPPTGVSTNSSGILSWSASAGYEIAGYVIYAFNPISDALDDDGHPVFNEIGRSATNSFVLPAINAASTFFGVRALSIGGRMSAMGFFNDRTTAVDLTHNWLHGVSLGKSAAGFVRRKTDSTVNPASITVTASPYNFSSPQYKWYIDGVLQAGQTASTLVVPQFTTTQTKRIEVRVNETGSSTIYTAAADVTYVEESIDSASLQIDASRQSVTFDNTDVPNPSSQTTTLTARKQNISPTPVVWSMKRLDGTTLTAASFLSATTGDSVTMTSAQFVAAIGTGDGVVITATAVATFGTTVTSVLTITKTRNLTAVLPGAPTLPGTPLTYVIATLPAGNVETRGTLTWVAPAGASGLSYYEVGLKKSSAIDYVFIQTSALSHTWVLDPDVQYDYTVRAVDKFGNKGSYVTLTNQLSAKDTTVPAAPTLGTSGMSVKSAYLQWTNVSDADLSHVQIFEASVTAEATAPLIPSQPFGTSAVEPSKSSSYHRTGLTVGNDYYYWLKSVDSSGNISPASLRIGPITPVAMASEIENSGIVTEKIQDLAVTRTSSFYFNYEGWANGNTNLWFCPLKLVTGYAFVGYGLGRYTFTAPSTYTFVGPGLGDYEQFSDLIQYSTGILAGGTGSQVVLVDGVIVFERNGSADDRVGARCLRMNDGKLLPELYSNLVARNGKSTYSLNFRDTSPLPGVVNTYGIHFLNNNDPNVRFYEANVRATLYRK